jgi:hypothetical protein
VVLCWAALAQATSHGKRTEAEEEKVQRDREAIRALAGNYRVEFSFTETVSFQEGYRLKKPYETDGHEIVRVIRDDEDVISLQHILVGEGVGSEQEPSKHWRQDWVYEPEQVFEYIGHQTWRTRRLDVSERRGKWAQLVYQVDDSPRYAAVAEWVHQHGVSAWTSSPTWRPLPRRETTTRQDYDVLVSVNRHALTPGGWVHEQDNSKLILDQESRLLAREIGVNAYTDSQQVDGRIAEAYWDLTKAFWAEVRDEWQRLQNTVGTFRVNAQSPSGKLSTRILALADDVKDQKLGVEIAAARARDLIRASTTSHVADLDDAAADQPALAMRDER